MAIIVKKYERPLDLKKYLINHKIIQVSFDLSEYTAEVVAVGTLRLLDAIKTCGMEKEVYHILALRAAFILRHILE